MRWARSQRSNLLIPSEGPNFIFKSKFFRVSSMSYPSAPTKWRMSVRLVGRKQSKKFALPTRPELSSQLFRHEFTDSRQNRAAQRKIGAKK